MLAQPSGWLNLSWVAESLSASGLKGVQLL